MESQLGVSDTEHTLAWVDTAADETDYLVERSTNGDSWAEIARIGPQEGYPRHRISSSNLNDRHLYRIRTFRASDNSYSSYSNTYGAPKMVERNHVRVFYNTEGCPSLDPNKTNCVPDVNNAAGENEMAARIADVIEAAHAEYSLFGLRDPWVPDGAGSKEPVNLVWADGGGDQAMTAFAWGLS